MPITNPLRDSASQAESTTHGENEESSREPFSVLTINGGSSSIRFALYEKGEPLRRRLEGKVDRIGLSGTNLTFRDSTGESQDARTIDLADHSSAVTFLLDWLDTQQVFASVSAVGHRVVHGMIGTVSPAGGNFEEPVTQSTLGTVKTFLGLSYDRAYKRSYPAIDPLISWSRYREQLRSHFDRHVHPGWMELIESLAQLLRDGSAIHQMMQVTGEEGISLEDFVTYQKSLLLDIAYLQQDAFDPVDVSVPLERQKEMLLLLKRLIDRDRMFKGKDEARVYFTRLTGLFRNLNYSRQASQDYATYLQRIENLPTTGEPKQGDSPAVL